MPISRRQNDRLFASLILLIHGFMFLPAFVLPGRRVFCYGLNDVATQFAHWRAFAAAAWRAGEAPLWCPLTFGGQAFLGNFQSAALYPPNIPYLVLPLSIALNLEMLLHLALFALGVYALGRRWGISPAGSFLAAMAASFSGPHFQALAAGHLTIVTTLAWLPVLLLALHNIAIGPFVVGGTCSAVSGEGAHDILTREQVPATTNWGWTLAGAAALAMQVLAGHPQMVYYTLLTGGLYFVIVLAGRRRWAELDRAMPVWDSSEFGAVCSQPNRTDETENKPPAWTSALLLPISQGLIVVVLGFGLAAFQLAAGFAALTDIERGAGYGMAAARAFSPPPETLLTIFFPDVIGNDIQTPYWGRHRYLNLFIGVFPLALAAVGMARGQRAPRWAALAMILVLFFLMIAGLTPLFPVVYHGLPGYGLFRVYARWAQFWSVFVALAAGMGIDVLRAGLTADRGASASKAAACALLPNRLLGAMAGLGFMLAAGALAARALSGPGSALGEAWAQWFDRFHSDPAQFTPQALFRLTSESANQALGHALRSVTLAGLTLLAAGGLPLMAMRLPAARRGRVAALLLALGAFEGLIYSVRFMEYTSADQFYLPAETREAVLEHVDPANRCIVFAIGLENLLMPLGIASPAGYDQFVPRRMGAFLNRSQEEFEAPEFAGMRAFSLSSYHPRMRLLRVSHVLQVYSLIDTLGEQANPGELVYRGELLHLYRATEPPLPEAFLVERWRGVENLASAVGAVFAEDFNPEMEAVVEREPTFPPGAEVAAVRPLEQPFAHVTGRGRNFIEVEAWTPRQAILVITDGYMNGWRAEAVDGTRLPYHVVPADAALRGVGLGPGLHRLRLIYWPNLLTVGLWLNIAALILFAGGVALMLRNRRKLSQSPNS